MRLVTFRSGNSADRLGLLRPDRSVLDLAAACNERRGEQPPMLVGMQALIEAGDDGLQAVRWLASAATRTSVYEPGAYTLRAPLPLPIQMRDFMAFELHVQQAGAAIARLRSAVTGIEVPAPGMPDVWYRQPIYYKCNRFVVNHPNADVVWPRYSQLMDYELELACVIGRGGRDISRNDARAHIFGFTIFNDFSARDAQMLEMQGPLGPAKGKDFDGANAMGPCLVTADEFDDVYNLSMIARVNGELRSRGSSKSMHWGFEDIIEHISRDETLYAGEILGSGTIGNGCGLETLQFLNDGDRVELEIEGIGTLANRVVRAGN